MEVIQRRRSVRFFTDQPILREDLDALITAGIYAPSGSNWQNQRFLLVTDKPEIERIGASRYVFPWLTKSGEQARERKPGGLLGESAALILVFADALENDRRLNGEYHIWEPLEVQNTAASIQNILLVAAARGIGTCWISASDRMCFTRLFSGGSWRRLLANYAIPNSYKLHGIIACGYPRKTDELGYPSGEAKHGATLWQAVERKPLDYYLITRREARPNRSVPSAIEAAQVRLLGWLARGLTRLLHRIDLTMSRIEIKPFIGEERLAKPKK